MMSEKKYTSGKAVDAEIQRLLDLKKEIAGKKLKVFNDAISKNGFTMKLSDLSDSDIREFAKIINYDFEMIVDAVNKNKQAKKQKQTPVSVPSTMTVNNQPVR